MLKHLGAAKAALALVLRHLVDAMELLEQALLVAGGQAGEAGVAAQHALLLRDGLAAMLIEPVAKVAGRCGAGVVVRAGLRAERSAVRLTRKCRANAVGVGVAVWGVCRPGCIRRSRIGRRLPIGIRVRVGTALIRLRRRC